MGSTPDKPRGERLPSLREFQRVSALAEGYTLRPFALPIDWLECRFMASRNPKVEPWGNDDVVPLGKFALRRLGSGTQHWKRRDALLNADTGRNLGTVLSCPHNARAGAPGSVMFKLSNDCFYDYSWYGVLTGLMDFLGWRYEATTQLDLSADGRGFLVPFRYAAKELIVPASRSEWNVRRLPGLRGLKAVELGTRGGNKFARLYQKEKEIHLSGKYYIADYWKDCGEDDISNVERCEISVKGVELRRYVPEERDRGFLELLTSREARASLYMSMAAQFMRFHTGEERSRDRTDLVTWDWTRVVGSEDVATVQRAPRLLDLGYNATKAAIRWNFTVYVATGKDHYRLCAVEAAEACGLVGWMEERANLWAYQAPKLMREGAFAPVLFDRLQGTTSGDVEAEIVALREERAALRADLERWRLAKLTASGIVPELFDVPNAPELDPVATVRAELNERRAKESEERAVRKDKRAQHKERMRVEAARRRAGIAVGGVL